MQPWTVPGEPMTFTAFTEYFLANGLFRFRIPMLFIISGFLYAMHDQKPYKERIHKRLRTLLIPYVLWSTLALLFTFLLETFPAGQKMVIDSHIVQIDQTRMLLSQYHWYEIIARWLFVPVSYQLWFIRVLLIYNLAYPWIKWCISHPVWRWVFFGIAVLMWLGTVGLYFVEGEGLLFFSLGVWMQKTSFSIESPSKRLQPRYWGILFLTLITVKTYLAFKAQPLLGNAIYPVLSILHKATVLSGLIFCWYGLDSLVKWFMEKKWFVWTSAFAFMIYALHAPLVAYLIDPALALLSPLPGSQMLAFILLPLSIIISAIGIGVLIRWLLPGLYSLMTGGRGLNQS